MAATPGTASSVALFKAVLSDVAAMHGGGLPGVVHLRARALRLEHQCWHAAGGLLLPTSLTMCSSPLMPSLFFIGRLDHAPGPAFRELTTTINLSRLED